MVGEESIEQRVVTETKEALNSSHSRLQDNSTKEKKNCLKQALALSCACERNEIQGTSYFE